MIFDMQHNLQLCHFTLFLFEEFEKKFIKAKLEFSFKIEYTIWHEDTERQVKDFDG